MIGFKNIGLFFVILTVFSSCILDEKTENRSVDAFYTTRNYGQFQVLPLSKPIKLHQDDQSKEWKIEYLKHSFKQHMNIENINSIGIEETFIYGKVKHEKQTIDGIEKGDLVYARKFGGTLISQEPMALERVKRAYPIDSKSKTSVLPERWFVINVADSTTEAFFSKKHYEEYLKEKGISGKMYDINRYHKQFKATGILP